MPEELPVENDGAVEPTQTQTQAAETDWQKRYTDTHADWNRLNGEITTLRSDPQALVEFLKEHHPDLLEEEEAESEEEFEPDEAERPMTRGEFEAYKKEEAEKAQQRTAQQQYETDLKAFVNDRELSPLGERAIRGTAVKSPEELKKAVDEWFEYEESLKGSAKPKPRVPHVPTNGQAGTGVPDWSKMTQGEINRYLTERAQAIDAQT